MCHCMIMSLTLDHFAITRFTTFVLFAPVSKERIALIGFIAGHYCQVTSTQSFLAETEYICPPVIYYRPTVHFFSVIYHYLTAAGLNAIRR